jgi:RHS repeat-associated protein
VWQYKYDALNRRVEKTGPNSRREFLWHGDSVIQEIERGRSVAAWIFDTYTYAPLATVQQGRVYAVINDHLGTPRELIDRRGAVVWSIELAAWGRELVGTGGAREGATPGGVEQNIRFQGQYLDTETGLHYSRHRYYDPETGGFVSDDPVGLLGGLNGYQYAPNPTGYVDPWGLAGDPADATHITYEGVKDGKPYIGYASKPGLGHSADDVLKYRYPNTDHFDVPPKPFFVGDGLEGKATARGLEQRVFEDRGGLKGTSNQQNPVGENNPNRDKYLKAADKHRADEAAKKEEAAKKKKKDGKEC